MQKGRIVGVYRKCTLDDLGWEFENLAFGSICISGVQNLNERRLPCQLGLFVRVECCVEFL